MTEQQIIAAISDGLFGLSGISSVNIYTEEMRESDFRGELPMILLEQIPGNYADDFGAAGHAEELSFNALVCVEALEDDSLLAVRELTRRVASRINHSNWGVADLGLAQLGVPDFDNPRPDLEQYRIMAVGFTHHAVLEV